MEKDAASDDWDLFISHAFEDKESLVAPLARALAEFGVRVWYDDFALKMGESLSRSIDRGLARSGYGLVVLSPAFLAKKWPEYELRGLVAREMVADKVILPLWHCVSYADVLAFSPSLADRKAIRNENTSIAEIAIEIIETVRPDIFTKILRRAALIRTLEYGKIQEIPPGKIDLEGPVQHRTLPDDLVGRIRLLRAAFFEVDPHSMEYWLDSFQRDTHPTREIVFWEHVAAAYLESIAQLKAKRRAKRKQIYYFTLTIALGISDKTLPRQVGDLPLADMKVIAQIYASAVPPFDMDEEFDKADPEDMSEEELRSWEDWDKESFPDVPEHLIRSAMKMEHRK